MWVGSCPLAHPAAGQQPWVRPDSDCAGCSPTCSPEQQACGWGFLPASPQPGNRTWEEGLGVRLQPGVLIRLCLASRRSTSMCGVSPLPQEEDQQAQQDKEQEGADDSPGNHACGGGVGATGARASPPGGRRPPHPDSSRGPEGQTPGPRGKGQALGGACLPAPAPTSTQANSSPGDTGQCLESHWGGGAMAPGQGGQGCCPT